MKKIILFSVPILLLMGTGIFASSQEKDIDPPGPNEVRICPNCVIMPLKRILLVRKDSNYCAIKFLKFQTEKAGESEYAQYESYYQSNKTGDFSNKTVEFRKEELSDPKPCFSFSGHPFSFGAKKEIQCGLSNLWWTGKGAVYFFARYQTQGDYGFEFAPTKWTDISEVNVFDSRLKWYKFDERRKARNIPVDQL